MGWSEASSPTQRNVSTYHDVEKRRYALRLAHVGDAFRGFQRQPGQRTVQEVLGLALADLGIEPRIDAAARTDAGVHALGQVVSFWARQELDPEALRIAVNRAAPRELVCLEAARVPPSFHARASASQRRYVYLVGTPPPDSMARYAWALPDIRAFPDLSRPKIDAGAMQRALALAQGTHDFAGFARPGAQTRKSSPDATVRTLARAVVIPSSWAPLYALIFEGQGFLRAMVRNLAGTAVTAGLGLAPPESVSEILGTRRPYRGVRAPGWGLTLVEVVYPAGAWK